MLNNVLVSVLTTYRLTTADGGMVTAVVDGTGYRRMLAEARPGAAAGVLGLPWSRYFNWLWWYQLGPNYRNLPAGTMVAMAVPLHARTPAAVEHPQVASVDAELIWHPFAVTTVAHVRLAGESWRTPQPLDGVLDEVLRTPWSGTTVQVRNGLPIAPVGPGWVTDAAGRAGRLDPVAVASLVSGLHHGTSAPAGIAASLATRFQDPSPDRSHPLRTAESFVAVRGSDLGMVLPVTAPNSARAHRCLHANYTTVLALMQNLLALRGGAGQYWEWYWTKADAVLRSLRTRAAHPATATCYRSILPELWLADRGYP